LRGPWNAQYVVCLAQVIDKFGALLRRFFERPSKLCFKALSSCELGEKGTCLIKSRLSWVVALWDERLYRRACTMSTQCNQRPMSPSARVLITRWKWLGIRQ